MIGYIEGEVSYKEGRALIVRTGGIGYLVAVTTETSERAQEGVEIKLWTHLSVREDALDLFGFTRRDELELFRLLIGISGIGPKSALNVLSLADIKTLTHAIGSGDGAYLTKVSGIGKKLGQKIVLELKEKIGGIAESGSTIPHAETEAIDALEALGYNPRDTREIVRSLARNNATTQEIIRKALQTIGGH